MPNCNCGQPAIWKHIKANVVKNAPIYLCDKCLTNSPNAGKVIDSYKYVGDK